MGKYNTRGVNKDTSKQDYRECEWVLTPLGYCDWKWNSVWGNYSTYEQKLLAGMLFLSSEQWVIHGNSLE